MNTATLRSVLAGKTQAGPYSRPLPITVTVVAIKKWMEWDEEAVAAKSFKANLACAVSDGSTVSKFNLVEENMGKISAGKTYIIGSMAYIASRGKTQLFLLREMQVFLNCAKRGGARLTEAGRGAVKPPFYNAPLKRLCNWPWHCPRLGHLRKYRELPTLKQYDTCNAWLPTSLSSSSSFSLVYGSGSDLLVGGIGW